MAATRVHINPDILTWAKERRIQRDYPIIEKRVFSPQCSKDFKPWN